jgi:hypothetical protein
MDLTFVYLPGFVREWNRHGLSDSDLSTLEETIARAPDAVPIVRGTGGLRKIRFAPPSLHRGKSGAMRVGFAYFRTKAAIVVVAMFAKNEAQNFTAAQRVEIRKVLAQIERSFQ